MGDFEHADDMDKENFIDEHERYEDALRRIEQWAHDAYPHEMFPEPDMKAARSVLLREGITLGSVAAHCMRHALKGVGDIAKQALEASE